MANPPDRNQLDTGIGGFTISADDDPSGRAGIYTYDPGDPDRPATPDYPNRDISLHGGNVSVDHTEKDLSKTTKVTLGHFLGKRTRVNWYPIDAPTSPDELKELDLQRRGTGATPTLLPSPNEAQFAKDRDISGVSSTPDDLLGYSGGITYPQPQDLTRGFTNPGGVSGNEVLEIEAQSTGYIRTLLGNNRFQPDRTYIVDFNNPDGFNPQIYMPSQSRERVSINALSGIASELGNLSVDNDKLKDVFKSLPEQTGISAKNPLDDLDISSIIDTLDEPDSESFTSISNDFWTVQNSSDLTFTNSSLQSAGVAAVNAAVAAAIGGTLFGLGAAIGSIDNIAESTKTDFDSPVLGSSSKVGSQLGGWQRTVEELKTFFSFAPTRNPYGECVLNGVSKFLFGGVDFGENIIGSTSKLLASTGQINVVTRQLNKAMFKLAQDLGSPAFSGNSFNDISNSIQRIISIFSSNKIIAIINMFAMIGDATLQSDRYVKSLKKYNDIATNGERGIGGTELGEASTISDGQGSLNLTRGDLGYSTRKASSLLFQNVGRMDRERLGPFAGDSDTMIVRKSLISNWSSDIAARNVLASGGHSDIKTARIPSDMARYYEESLKSEYVPFYFHDIRTNEILSFHAFLEALSDTYSPSIEPIEVMGRVEPIRIYKGTQRKISLTFWVVSLSGIDFNIMWDKINKLVTLVYPQYTEGRRVEASMQDNAGKQFKFVQPFSQMMSASPMIRLRVGDVIKSNYTDDAAEDLFGANLEGTFDEEAVTETSEEAARRAQKKTDEFTLLFKLDKSNESDLVNTDNALESLRTAISANKGNIQSIKILGSCDELAPEGYNWVLSQKRVETAFKIVKGFLSSQAGGGLITSPDTSNKLKFTGSATIDSIPIETVNEGELPTPEPRKKKGEIGHQPNRRAKIIITYKDAAALTAAATPTTPAAPGKERSRPQLIREFLDHNNNSIIRTFKETGAGGGLAGFIESMSFEWISSNQVTWEIDVGKKAPKLCKVQMEFSPIHDITPGLNSQGNNRAPVYNISSETNPDMVKLPFVPEKTRAEINAAERATATAAAAAVAAAADEERKRLEAAASEGAELEKTLSAKPSVSVVTGDVLPPTRPLRPLEEFETDKQIQKISEALEDDRPRGILRLNKTSIYDDTLSSTEITPLSPRLRLKL